jgi:hypothetical protein
MNTINPPRLTSIPPIPPLPNPISTHIVKLAEAVLLRNPLRRPARPCNLDGHPVIVRSSACEVARHNLPLHKLSVSGRILCFQLRSLVQGGPFLTKFLLLQNALMASRASTDLLLHAMWLRSAQASSMGRARGAGARAAVAVTWWAENRATVRVKRRTMPKCFILCEDFVRMKACGRNVNGYSTCIDHGV